MLVCTDINASLYGYFVQQDRNCFWFVADVAAASTQVRGHCCHGNEQWWCWICTSSVHQSLNLSAVSRPASSETSHCETWDVVVQTADTYLSSLTASKYVVQSCCITNHDWTLCITLFYIQFKYRKTSNTSSRLLLEQVTWTPGLYWRPGLYWNIANLPY